jgi:hypothetical protein
VIRSTDPGYGFFSTNLDLGGVMFQNSLVRVSDVKDGTSNTLAVGECYFDTDTKIPNANGGVDTSKQKWACIWAGMTGLRPNLIANPKATANSIWISDVMWWMDEISATVNGTAPQAFSSRHHGGAFFGFCDGSVRFFREGLNADQVRFLGGRKDGVIVNIDF